MSQAHGSLHLPGAVSLLERMMLMGIMCHSLSCNSSNWWHGEWIRNGGLQNVPSSGTCLRSTWTEQQQLLYLFSIWSLMEFLNISVRVAVVSALPCSTSRIWSLRWKEPEMAERSSCPTHSAWMSELASVWAWWKHSGSSPCTGVPLLLPSLGLSLPEFL